jgi:drug/metabolite transporter (DMT)-like permease
MSPIPFIIMAVTMSAIGQVLIKKGINVLGNIDFSSGLITSYMKIFLLPYVILGSLVYVISLFIWVYALSKVALSFAYPFLALSYVMIIVASRVFLGETVPFLRVLGILVICIGILLVAKS